MINGIPVTGPSIFPKRTFIVSKTVHECPKYTLTRCLDTWRTTVRWLTIEATTFKHQGSDVGG